MRSSKIWTIYIFFLYFITLTNQFFCFCWNAIVVFFISYLKFFWVLRDNWAKFCLYFSPFFVFSFLLKHCFHFKIALKQVTISKILPIVRFMESCSKSLIHNDMIIGPQHFPLPVDLFLIIHRWKINKY